MIPKPVVDKFIGFDSLEADLSLVLDIKKFEEEVKNSGSGLIKGHIPSFLYKTDEENIFNLKSKVESLCDGKTPFGLTTKVDGSSHTTYFKKDIYGDWQVGVLSRSLEKKLDQSVIDHWEDSFGQKYKEGRDSDGKVIFYSDSGELTSDSSHLTPIMKDLDDPWVSLAKSSGLLSRGLEFCKKWDSELAFRGEIFGKDLKGSGNVFNPHSKLNRGLVLFGVDDLSSGYATRINYSSLFNLENVCKELQLEYTKPQIIFPTSFEDLIKRCEEIFDKEKELGRIIEGVVIRTHFTNDLSCKYLNPEYDSKK